MEADGTEPNLVMLNLLMNAFSIAGKHLEATAVFEHMKESVSTLLNQIRLFMRSSSIPSF